MSATAGGEREKVRTVGVAFGPRIFAALLLLTIFVSGVARADGPFASVGVAYGQDATADGHTYESEIPFVLRGGYSFAVAHHSVDAYVEYQQFKKSDGAGLLSVSRAHREGSLWARYRILQIWYMQPYVSLGAGVSADSVKTDFNGESTTASQDPEFLMGMATGLSFAIYRGLEAQVEARLTSASSFQPNPLLQAGIHVGYRF